MQLLTLGCDPSSQTRDKACYANLACLKQMTLQLVTSQQGVLAVIPPGTAETTFVLLNSMSTRMHCRLKVSTADLHGPDLEHILLGAFEVLEPPLVHSTIHTSRDKLGVIRQPRQAPHLSIMPPVPKTPLA